MCQQNKNLTHRTHTSLYHITVLPEAQPFEQIAMDLITGLPKSKGYDTICSKLDGRVGDEGTKTGAHVWQGISQVCR
jgi:hypothetical protein